MYAYHTVSTGGALEGGKVTELSLAERTHTHTHTHTHTKRYKSSVVSCLMHGKYGKILTHMELLGPD
jgi:hypothetical protein